MDPAPRYPALVEERYESELARSQQVLDEVDRALERLGDGTYGSCETCGKPVPASDLAADPTRRGCGHHGTPGDADDPGISPAG